MNNRTKTVLYYLGAIVALLVYFILENSEGANSLLNKADHSNTHKLFEIIAVIGLAKYSALALGISIPTLLTALLILKKKREG